MGSRGRRRELLGIPHPGSWARGESCSGKAGEAKGPLSRTAGHAAATSQLGASSIPFWDERGRSSPHRTFRKVLSPGLRSLTALDTGFSEPPGHTAVWDGMSDRGKASLLPSCCLSLPWPRRDSGEGALRLLISLFYRHLYTPPSASFISLRIHHMSVSKHIRGCIDRQADEQADEEVNVGTCV